MPILKTIDGRPRDLGGFTVARLLPAPGFHMVGPFIFFDHMGPSDFAPGQGLDVRPHPHIGLATVTYLFEGAMTHRDSLGTVLDIEPGAVNWMTAGRGIVHSERSPDALRARGHRLHGIQSWVALPKAYAETEPAFVHHAADSLPDIELPGVELRLIAGSAFGATSPVQFAHPIVYAEAWVDAGAQLTLPADWQERGVYVVAGSVTVDGAGVAERALAVLTPGADAVLAATVDSHVMLL
ncbi:MAG TPA: pirin family protein, partial [Polymorphobacter sp.]|nr:pirin family protein [Polymorphobacter sp.]